MVWWFYSFCCSRKPESHPISSGKDIENVQLFSYPACPGRSTHTHTRHRGEPLLAGWTIYRRFNGRVLMGESFNPLLLLLLYLWDAKNEFCSAMLSIVPIVAKAVELQCKRKIWLSWGWYNYNCTSGFQWCVVAEEHDVALGQMWWDWPPFCHACFVRLVLCQHFECHFVAT